MNNISLNRINISEDFSFPIVQMKQGLKHVGLAGLSLSLWGVLYYTEVCDLDRGLSYSCGKPLASYKINLGLPFIVLTSVYKAHQVFKDLRT